MEFMTLVELITQAATLLMIGSGIPPCINMWKTGRTDNIPFLFFLLGELNAICFLVYGLMQSNNVLIFLNCVSSVVTGGCILSYLAVVQSKLRPLAMLSGALLYLTGLYYYLNYVIQDETKMSDNLGFCGCLVSTFMLSTPFLDIIDCMKRKSCEGMSHVMLFGALLCSACWFLYGNLLQDPYIYLPNIPGVVSGLGKIGLILYFGTVKHKHSD